MTLLFAVLDLVLLVLCLATLRRFPKCGALLMAAFVLAILFFNKALRERGLSEVEATRYGVYMVAIAIIGLFILLRVATKLDAPVPDAHVNGKYNESLMRLPEASDAEAQAIFDQGRQCERRRRYDDALRPYDRVLELEPPFVKCMTAKGILHCMKGSLAEGKQVFERAAALRPDSAYVLHLLARAEREMGLEAAADKHEREAAENLGEELKRRNI